METIGLNYDVRPERRDDFTDYARAVLAAMDGFDGHGQTKLYVDDARFCWHTDGKLSYTSVDQVCQRLAGLGESGMKLTTRYAGTRVVPLTPQLAFLSTRFETEGSMQGTPGFQYGGVVTMLLSRSETDWRVLQGHTSTPAGPPQ